MKFLPFSLVFASILVACSSLTNDAKSDNVFLRPSSAVVNSVFLDQMTEELDELEFHSVLIIQDGELVYEKYFTRNDEEWGEPIGEVAFDENTLHDLRSGTKSVVSALVGIAVSEGHIAGLETPITELLNEEVLSDYDPPPDQPPLRLVHLLSMSSGFEWNERMSYENPENSEIQMWESETPARFALGQPVAFEPGSTFNYNGGLTQVLVEILEQNTGVPVDKYAQEKLFTPLQINDVTWVRHRSGQVWGASGLRLNVIDFAKFGQLYLQDGRWLGKQVLPAEWVSATYVPRIDTRFRMKMEYGLHWWLPGYLQEGSDLPARMAQGNGGQTLLLFPSHKLMVVTMAGYYNDVAKMLMLPPKLTRDFVLPAMGIEDVSMTRSPRTNPRSNAP
jgi:CubicO group peptidase (beta-lactamase class C family)